MDRKLYKKHMQNALLNYPNLHIRAASVHDLVFDVPHPFRFDHISGVQLGASVAVIVASDNAEQWPDSGEVISCSQVVLCTGTFLSGEIHIGTRRVSSASCA